MKKGLMLSLIFAFGVVGKAQADPVKTDALAKAKATLQLRKKEHDQAWDFYTSLPSNASQKELNKAIDNLIETFHKLGDAEERVKKLQQ